MSRNLLVLAALAVLLPLAAVAHAQAPSQSGPYKVLQTVKVGGRWRYGLRRRRLRPTATLYVARSGAAGHIGVFNLDTFAQVGDIPAPARTVRSSTTSQATASPRRGPSPCSTPRPSPSSRRFRSRAIPMATSTIR